MDSIINLLYVFFNNDFFLVIIAALVLILIVVIIGIIKIQKENDRLMMLLNVSKEEVIKEENNLIMESKEKEVETNIINAINEGVLDKCEEIVEIKEEKPRVPEINPIEAYEKDEELNAVISTKELESIEHQRDELYGVENNAKLIEEYETEQENKAIISYNELLKNANGLELNYIEKPREEENAPLVKQVEIKNQKFKSVVYGAEEEYLEILKDLRSKLING